MPSRVIIHDLILFHHLTGEFGVVYRGILTNETDLNSMPEPVAVKTLKGLST